MAKNKSGHPTISGDNKPMRSDQQKQVGGSSLKGSNTKMTTKTQWQPTKAPKDS